MEVLGGFQEGFLEACEGFLKDLAKTCLLPFDVLVLGGDANMARYHVGPAIENTVRLFVMCAHLGFQQTFALSRRTSAKLATEEAAPFKGKRNVPIGILNINHANCDPYFP